GGWARMWGGRSGFAGGSSNPRRTSAVRSVDQLSLTTSSKSPKSWSRTLPTASGNREARLRVVITIDTNGRRPTPSTPLRPAALALAEGPPLGHEGGHRLEHGG